MLPLPSNKQLPIIHTLLTTGVLVLTYKATAMKPIGTSQKALPIISVNGLDIVSIGFLIISVPLKSYNSSLIKTYPLPVIIPINAATNTNTSPTVKIAISSGGRKLKPTTLNNLI